MQKEREVLKRYFGYNDFRENQKDVINAISEGRDVLALMPTGGGKSLCYQVPALSREGVCIVISPIISLMYDQVQALRKKQIKAEVLNSTLSIEEQNTVIKKMINSEAKFVYISPERLKNYDFIEAMKQSNITLIAIDEAHCISQWGHEFRPEYSKIDLYIKSVETSSRFKNGKIQKIALTATANPMVREEIAILSGLNNPSIIVKGFDRENLSFFVHHAESKKDKLFSIIRGNEGKPTIIYCSSKKKVDATHKSLTEQGFIVGKYHGGMSKENREHNQDLFLNDELQILVATNAFGMGVDKPNVRLVIHYDMPDTIEGYYQEAGRAGRDLKPSECHLLFSPHDRRLHEFLMDASLPPKHIMVKLHSLIQEWDGEFFNPSIDALKVVIPSLKDSMVNSALLYLEEAGIIGVSRVLDKNGVVPVAEIIKPYNSLDKTLEKITERRIHKMRSLEVMERYCSGNVCHRNFMLNYFGEKKDEPCGRCSSCLEHLQSLENKENYTQEGIVVVNIVKQLQEKKINIKSDTLAKLLLGDFDLSVLSIGGHKLSGFGELSFLSKDIVITLISYMKEEQYISDYGDTNEYLYMTNKGNRLLNGERFIYIDSGVVKPSFGNNQAHLSDKDYMEKISLLRKELSDEHHVSEFMVWTTATMKELIEKKPKDIEELGNIKTLTKKKIDMFGDKIINVFKGE
jgi:ATP-dependent DNA helicase RecQ